MIFEEIIKMNVQDLLDKVGQFTWFWNDKWFIETTDGNFIWSDPRYYGDNIISIFHGDYRDVCNFLSVNFGRDKGKYIIRDYCGDEIEIGKEIFPKKVKP